MDKTEPILDQIVPVHLEIFSRVPNEDSPKKLESTIQLKSEEVVSLFDPLKTRYINEYPSGETILAICDAQCKALSQEFTGCFNMTVKLEDNSEIMRSFLTRR